MVQGLILESLSVVTRSSPQSSLGGAPSLLPTKVRAACFHTALLALWLCPLTDVLAMAFQQQIGSHSRVESGGYLSFDGLLSFVVGDSVIFALLPALQAHQNMRAV